MPASFILLNRKTNAKQKVAMHGSSLSIGKSDGNDIRLNQVSVSRKHCIIEHHNGEYFVKDNGSRNGTFVNGQKVVGQAQVSAGQEIQIGDFSLILEEHARSTVKQPRPQGAPVADAPSHAPSLPKDIKITPVELKKEIHSLLLDRMDLKHTDMSNSSEGELRHRTTEVCTMIVQEFAGKLPPWLTPASLVKEVVDEAVGLGMLEELLADEEVDEIMVCSWDKTYVERKGKIVLTAKQFTDDSQVVAIIRRILAPIGRRIDETTPMADGRLADGSRVNAIIPPLALSGPTLTIRKFATTPFVVDDLIGFKSLNREMADFLALAVKHRCNIVISGGTGSGKTTLLNVTSNYIPEDERIVTVEDSAELQLAQPHVVRLESRPPNLEGKNAIPIRDLVKNCLRMRPDRIVVGECRGGEALDMLQAMNTGHDGSLTTLHANSARDAISRMETLVLMSGMELPARAIREQIASAVHFIVQISRMPDGTRKMKSITEVTGMEGDIVTLQPVFEFKQEGFDEDGNVKGYFTATGTIPDFVQGMRQRGIEVDLNMFKEKKA